MGKILSIIKSIIRLLIAILNSRFNFYIAIRKICFKLFHYPFIVNINYHGLKIYYSYGTSLIRRIKNSKSNIYEESTCKSITQFLNIKQNPNFIDVGANIGLISAYVLNHVPKVNIYAFEPGPHQYNLFNKTIIENKLEKRIKLYNLALSNTNGTMEFNIHSTQDVSGDGFYDTERAGKTNIINVEVLKLDDWWENNKKPNIDVIKIDVEGAELWILEGAVKMLKSCKPIIVLEICNLNYRNYPYTENEVLELLISNNYSVFTEEGSLVNKNNLKSFQEKNIYNYVCKKN